MLLKVAILLFIVRIIKDYISILNYVNSQTKSANKFKESINKNGFTDTFFMSLIVMFSTTYYFLMLYFVIGQVNLLMTWLSAIQILLLIYNNFKFMQFLIDIKENNISKPISILYLIFVALFDTFYIALAIMYTYFV